MRVLSPVGETLPSEIVRPTGESIGGIRLGILDNGKPNSIELLERAADHVVAEKQLSITLRHRKRNTSLGAEDIEDVAPQIDFAIVGVGDCAGCTAWSVRDAIELERLGVRTVTLITKPFEFLAQSVARTTGMPDLPLMVVDHPIAGLRADELPSRIEPLLDGILQALDTGSTKQEPAEATSAAASVDGDPESLEPLEVADDLTGYLAVNEEFIRRGWSDGLPIVPPAEALVQDYLTKWGRDPEEVVAAVPPQAGAATLRKIATNMVMAGCPAELLPVLEAAMRAMSRDEFRWLNSITGTGMQTPLMILSGPVVDELGFNGGLNALGPGPQTNASLGRTLRLIMTNIGGLRDQSTLGHVGKYSYVLAENQEANPWSPLHSDYEVPAGASAVTVVTGQAPMLIKEMTSTTGVGILHALCSAMAVPDSVNWNQYGDQVLILCPQHAGILARDGFDRAAIRRYIRENAQVPVGKFTPAFIEKQGRHRWPTYATDRPDTLIPILEYDEDLIVVVAGGAGTTSGFIPTYCQSRRVTEQIDLH